MAPGFPLPAPHPLIVRFLTGPKATMALPPTIYRATVELADTDRGCYDTPRRPQSGW